MGAVVDGAPLTDGAQDEDGHDRRSARGDDRSDQQADSPGDVTGVLGLDVDERITDQGTGHTAHQDGHERQDSGQW